MDAQMIRNRLAECGIPADDALAEKLLVYHTMLMDWNTRMDLTAVTTPEEMLDRHYVDSLIPLRTPGLIPERGNIIDVGTGAGFPGLALALALPEAHVTLLDSQQKRLLFLDAVAEALHLDHVTIVHARAEDGARTLDLREQFDLAIARAVAPLPVLAEYLLPYVRVGGQAVCWKGPSVRDELQEGRRAAHVLGGKLQPEILCPIPGRDWDHLLIPITKEASTPLKYPRKAGTPSKDPLGR